MKRHLLTAALAATGLLLHAAAANAALIVADDLNYADGTLGSNNGGTNGTAGSWSGSWSGTNLSLSGGAVLDTSGNSARAISTTHSGTIYFSAVLEKVGGTDTGYFAYFGLSSSQNPRTNDAVIAIADGGFRVDIENASNGRSSSALAGSVAVDQPYFLVGKLEFNVSGNDDRLTVWVDPTGEETSTITTSVTGRDLG